MSTVQDPVVVCVDDEPEVLRALARLLRREPYQVLATVKSEEAMTWILEKEARLVIADQRMPGITGLELLVLVRTCSPRTIRVMLSGQSDLSGIFERTRIEAIERLLHKPWDGEALKETIRVLLAQPEREATVAPSGS